MGSLVAELAEKLSSATNNFDIDEGTIYVNTSADTVAIGGTSPDGKFSIHQSDSADILNLYDGTDVVFSVIDGGNVLIGGITTAETIVGATPKVQVEGLGYANSSLSLFNNSNDTSGAYLDLGKSRGTSLNSDTIIQDGDFIGGINFVAADGVDRASRVAGIYAAVDGTPGADDTPGELLFYTTADGANSGTQRMVIKADGNVGIGTSNPSPGLGGSDITLEIAGATSPSLTINDTGQPEKYSLYADSNDLKIAYGSTILTTFQNDGRVGIGDSSPISPLQIQISATDSIPTNTLAQQVDNNVIVLRNESDSANYSGLKLETRTSGAAAWLIANEWKNTYLGDLVFRGRSGGADSAERMRIASDGKVGIGTTSPNQNLDVLNGAQITGAEGTSAILLLVADEGDDNGDGWRIASHQLTNYLTFANDTSGSYADKAIITSGGTLSVGDQTGNPSNNASRGVSLASSGLIHASRAGGVAYFDRATGDGDIVYFTAAQTTIGSIGNNGVVAYVNFYNAGNVGLKGSTNAVAPSSTTGSDRDNVIDLGKTSARFNDIHATNDTIQTSDRNEKQDIEELSEAEQRVAVAAKGLLRKFRWKFSVSEKGDNARIHFGIIAQDLKSAFEAEGLDAGRYAMFIHSEWWEFDETYTDDDGVEQTRTNTYDTAEEAPEGAVKKDRMGIRYSELLAFIISVI